MGSFVIIIFSLVIIFTIITLSIYQNIPLSYPQEEIHYAFIGTWDSEGEEDGQLKEAT